jgi:predicted unusual protein kinase regulating ubiquinone biosynthesis (AarF/ABC1/UbiB family)
MDAVGPIPTPKGVPPRLQARFARVMAFFIPMALGFLGWDILLRVLGLGSLARRMAAGRYQRLARRYRRLATRLGGVWIKAGQFLSARVDVLPESITAELAGLQDEVAPKPASAMRRVIEREFGRPVEACYTGFEDAPLASASLGQVHRARFEGQAVVVKIQRPDIRQLLEVDLAALRIVVGWLKRYRPVASRTDLDALVAEFSRTLWAEVDYLAEAEHARRFAAMFAGDAGVCVPRVYDDRTTRSVLTLEDVYATKITDYAAIEAAGIARAEVAHRLFRTYMHQIFEQGFFHADPHPGNLFVEPDGAAGWRLVFVDFGMVGQVSDEMRQGLRDLAIGLSVRDPDRLVGAYERLGILLPGTDTRRLRQAERAMFDRLWGKSMQELTHLDRREIRRMAHEFRDLVFELPFQLPSDLLFLGRCVAILSGICTGLHPEFNLFEGLAPFARGWLDDTGGDWVKAALCWITEEGRRVVGLPARLETALDQLERGELTVRAQAAPELEAQLERVRRELQRVAAAVAFAGLLVTGGILYGRTDLRLTLAAWAAALVPLALALRR